MLNIIWRASAREDLRQIIGIRDLLSGITHVLSQELGRLITIRQWQVKLRALSQGKRRHSKLQDAGQCFAAEPVMTSALLADRLNITQVSAIRLLDQLVEQDVVVEMTRRRAARIWATPGLAQMLGRMSARPKTTSRELAPALQPAENDEQDNPNFTQKDLRREGRQSVEKAMDEFSRMLDEVDVVLSRF